jgi:hypothetical protein
VRHRQTKEAATDRFEPTATAPHLDSTDLNRSPALGERPLFSALRTAGADVKRSFGFSMVDVANGGQAVTRLLHVNDEDAQIAVPDGVANSANRPLRLIHHGGQTWFAKRSCLLEIDGRFLRPPRLSQQVIELVPPLRVSLPQWRKGGKGQGLQLAQLPDIAAGFVPLAGRGMSSVIPSAK